MQILLEQHKADYFQDRLLLAWLFSNYAKGLMIAFDVVSKYIIIKIMVNNFKTLLRYTAHRLNVKRKYVHKLVNIIDREITI